MRMSSTIVPSAKPIVWPPRSWTSGGFLPYWYLKKTTPFTLFVICSSLHLVIKGYDFYVLFQIVHLKRFQFVNGRWIKSQKIVKFPRENFNPSAFLAPREAQSTWSLQSQSECPVEELQKLDIGDSSVSSISTTTVVSPPTSGKGLSLLCFLCHRLQNSF